MTITQIQLDDIAVDVVQKRIKNIHLRVYPPMGRVRLAAPVRVPLDTLRSYARSKLSWIREQQQKIRSHVYESACDYLDGETHYSWGERYPLSLIESPQTPALELRDGRLVLSVRPGIDRARKAATVDAWYRQQIKFAVPDLIAKWQPILGVQVRRFSVRKMKTRWGTCNTRHHALFINSELAKKPPVCLDYLVLHEMVHLLEPSHNARFKALMDRFMPDWRRVRQQLKNSDTASRLQE